MSLLRKASIVTTPTSYENGKILSVKPSIVLGEELVANGDFSNSFTNWISQGDSITIVDGAARINRITNTTFIQQNILTSGKTYLVEFDVLNKPDNNVTFNVRLGSNNVYDVATYEGTRFSKYITSNGVDFRIYSSSNSGVIYVDNVSVKEAIDADFDFTRNSSATRVNSQGLIEDMQILSGDLVSNGDFSQEGSELITNGDFDTDSDWTKGTQITIENGIANIASNDGSFQLLGQNNVVTIGKYYVLTYTIVSSNSGSLKFSSLGQINSTIGTHKLYFVATETAINIARNSGITDISIDNVSVKEVGQDWSFYGEAELTAQGARIYSSSGSYSSVRQSNDVLTIGNKYKITFNVISTNGTNLANNGSTITYDTSTTGNKTFYITASEVELEFKRAAPIATDVTISNISVIEITDDTNLPRIDYTGGEGHWLFEPQSTNLVTYSSDFSQFANISNVSITTGFTAPDGTNTANKIVDTGGNAHIAGYGGINTGKRKSIYARTVSGTGKISLLNSKNDPNALFDLTEQWQRFEIEHSGADFFYSVDFRNASVNLSEVLIWGAQLEEQSFATSYIPTNGEVNGVTRLADAAFGAGSSDLINSTEGVLYAEIAALADDLTNRVISINDGTTNNRVSIVIGSGTNQIRGQVLSSSTSFDFSTTSYNILNNNKIAISYKLNDFSMWINGTKVAADTSGNTPVGMNEINFNAGGTVLPFFGKTKCVAVFKEALTDAELTCLTTI